MAGGLVLAILQFAFALTWIIYVVYLPQLATDAGLSRSVVPWLLVADQAIFVVCDWAAGVHADRVTRTFGRLAPRVALVALVSGGAFLALPALDFTEVPGKSAAFIALIVVWSITSSALRAPPLVIFARHTSRPTRSWLAGLYLIGVGAAGAVAPYLGTLLAKTDPRIPFAISAGAVVVVSVVLVIVERHLEPVDHDPRTASRSSGGVIALFALALVLLAIGFQIHAQINSAPAYKRVTTDVDAVMPMFWIGFSVAMLPATFFANRIGGFLVMAVASVIGAGAMFFVARAGSLGALVTVQIVAGAAWGAILTGAFTAANRVTRPEREGSVTGLVFSMLATAAVARITIVATELPREPAVGSLLPALPAIAWLVGSVLVAVLALRTADRA
jgi:MFS family permease